MADPIPTDDQLLERYAREGDRGALDELARRHVDFVYASARRQVGDAHLAEDVTQAVFLLLMRKARSIRRGHLAGWLFNTTRYAAANARKIRARREHHEHLAASRKGEMTMPAEPVETQALMTVLDDALAALGAADREALILRYLQGREVAEVGTALGMSEATCRRRISRAVEKLRTYFGGRGITTLEAGAVVGVLQTAGAQKAPAGVIISAAATPAAAAIASGVGVSMMLVKLKIAALVMILLAGGVATMQVARRESPAPAQATPAGDPRDAVRALGQAIFTGDALAARGMAVGQEQDLAILDALAAPAVAAAALNRTLDARFGGGGPTLSYNVDFGFKDLPERARFNIDGVVATTPGPMALRMLRVENKWWVDTEQMSREQYWVGSAVIARAVTRSLDQIRAEVEEGLYPDRRAAISASGRLGDELVRRAAATTRPLAMSLKVPGTMPAPELEADPRETVIAFAEAVRAGDAQTAKEMVYGQDVDLSFIDAMAGAILAQQKLNHSVELKFGKATVPLVDLRILSDWARSAGRMFIFVRGDMAELPNPDGEVTMRLRAIDGRWRIDGGQLTEGRVDLIVNAANDRRNTLDRLRAQVEADYFPSREALADSLIRQVNESRQRAATTRSMQAMGMTVNVFGETPAPRNDPRDILREFAGAMQAGDASIARRQAHGTEDDLRLIDVYARSIQAQSRLNRLIDETYGKAERPLLRIGIFEELERVGDPALIRVTRDVAEMLNADGQVALAFIPVEDRWRIDMAMMATRLGREALIDQPAMAEAEGPISAVIEAGGFVKRESVQLGFGLMLRDARTRARAGLPPPATMPADDLPGSQLDPGPRDVAKLFAMAVTSGDWGVARLFATGTPEQFELVDTLARLSHARQRVNLLANEKFGPSRTGLFNMSTIDNWITRAPLGEVKIQDKTAELRMPGGEKALRFHRVDGRWRIDLSDFAPEKAGAEEALTKMVPVIESLHVEIAQGKFENRAQVVAELSSRLQPLMAAAGATTRPATTMPATMLVVDHSDPVSVAKAFLPTIMTGDAAAARALALGPEDEFLMIDGVCSAVRISRELNQAMDRKFGPGTPWFGIDIKETNSIDDLQLNVEGDEASFTGPSGSTFRLRRIDGRWRIDTATFSDKHRQMLGMIITTGKLLEDVRRDVEAGGYRDGVAAFTAIQKRLEAEIRKAAPATQPG